MKKVKKHSCIGIVALYFELHFDRSDVPTEDRIRGSLLNFGEEGGGLRAGGGVDGDASLRSSQLLGRGGRGGSERRGSTIFGAKEVKRVDGVCRCCNPGVAARCRGVVYDD